MPPRSMDAIKPGLHAEHQPIDETEEIPVNEPAEQFWRYVCSGLETKLLDADSVMITQLAAIQRMMTSAERGLIV